MNGEKLVQNIKSIAVAKGIKMKDLYPICGVTSGALSQWKSGKTKPHTATLDRIAISLGVSLQDLMEGTEKEIPASADASGEDAEFLIKYHRASPRIQAIVRRILEDAESIDAIPGDDAKE